MITYLIHMILCSGWMYLAYRIFLSGLPTLKFNRLFLLGCLIIPLVLPLVPSPFTVPSNPATITTTIQEFPVNTATLSITTSPGISNTDLALPIYILVSLTLFLRFTIHLFRIVHNSYKFPVHRTNGLRIIRLPGEVAPYSFMNTVFAGTSTSLSREILEHERGHTVQLHSLDILLSEMVKVFLWFNPFVYLIERSIKLNHEYLSDQQAIKNVMDIPRYQQVLLQAASTNHQGTLKSAFNNYLTLKKRLIMMTTKKPKINGALRIIGVIPVTLIAFFLFSATDRNHVPKVVEELVPQQVKGATDDELEEYKQISISNTTKDGFLYLELFSEQEIERMREIYLTMTEEQQNDQWVKFLKIPGPLPQNKPTEAQLQSFTNADTYGVWIDNKRVANDLITSYNPNDFGNVFISKLMPNAKNFGKHVYQVDLMTKDAYEQYRKSVLERKGKWTISVPYIKIQ